jgi:hypothetical protein
MRLAVSVLVVALIAGCTAIPEQRIRAFGDAYGEMKTAAETVYANYSSEDVARRKEAFETKLAAASPSQYFDLIVPKALAEPVDRGQTPPAIATNALAALEAGTVYNAALLALASGKSVEEVQQSVTALSGTIGSLGGVPWIGPVIGIIVGQVEKARARGELVATLTREYTITLPEGETRTGHLMDLLLDLLIEHADLMFQKRREIALQRAELLEFEGGNPGAAKIVADDMADDYTVLAQYRQLLVATKQYFRQLQDAAANPASDVQAATTVQIAGEIVAQSRLVVALIGGMP